MNHFAASVIYIFRKMLRNLSLLSKLSASIRHSLSLSRYSTTGEIEKDETEEKINMAALIENFSCSLVVFCFKVSDFVGVRGAVAVSLVPLNSIDETSVESLYVRLPCINFRDCYTFV
jgi:hypothetical protein